MKQYGFVYNDFQRMQSFIQSNNINDYDNILIQVFTGVVDKKFIENIIGEIISILPQAEIIGATASGEIYNESVLANSTVIAFTIFEKSKIKSTFLINDNGEYELGRNLVEKLVEEDTKAVILFSDGLVTRGWDIIKGIQSVNSDILICGGRASDNGYLKETFVFTKDGITNNGLVAVSLTGKELNITTESSLGWSTIGRLMTITKVENNRIYTIDNIKAVDIYRKYLGEEVAKGLPMTATEFPLIVKKDGLEMAKVAFLCNEDGSLSFFGDLHVNDKVQFGYGNINMLLDKSMEIADRIKNRNLEAIFIYSCYSRQSFMKEKIQLEIDPLSKIAPTFGFFTFGEYFTINKSHKLLNVTMTILGLSEGESNPCEDEDVLSKTDSQSKDVCEEWDFRVIKVLTHLVNEATNELRQANEKLQEQKNKLEQMNSITKSILQINSEMIASGNIDKILQMILDKAFDIIPKGKAGSVLLVEDGEIYYKATRGYNLGQMKDITYKLEDKCRYKRQLTEELFNPIIIEGLEKNLFSEASQYDSWKLQLGYEPYQSLACGIGIDDNLVGFINIYNSSESESFDEEDKSLLKYLCYDIAIALKNYKLLDNIVHMSRYDSLTGIYNRRYFKEMLKEILNKARLSEKTFVICAIDLNNLKIINDTYGHDAGDELLIKFVSVFKSQIDKIDVLGRTGGDEFTVIFMDKNKSQVIDVISKVCKVFESSALDFNGDKKEISFAYGLSEYLVDSVHKDELLKIADIRMYENKRMMKKYLKK